jgi:hypothetical protein
MEQINENNVRTNDKNKPQQKLFDVIDIEPNVINIDNNNNNINLAADDDIIDELNDILFLTRKTKRFEKEVKLTIDYAPNTDLKMKVFGMHLRIEDKYYTYFNSNIKPDKNTILRQISEHKLGQLPYWYTIYIEASDIGDFTRSYVSHYSAKSTMIDLNELKDFLDNASILLYAGSGTERMFRKLCPHSLYVVKRMNTGELGDGIEILKEHTQSSTVLLNNAKQAIISIHGRLLKLFNTYKDADFRATSEWKDLKKYFN